MCRARAVDRAALEAVAAALRRPRAASFACPDPTPGWTRVTE